MNERLKLIFISFICLLVFSGFKHDSLEVSVVNPMVKIFSDTFPKKTGSQVLHFKCAANEYEPAQFIIRAPIALERVTIELSDLENEDGYEIRNLQWNFEGFIPLDTNTPDSTRESKCGAHDYVPEGELIRIAPCKIPDPLLEDRIIDLNANSTQPVWVTVYVPSGTPAGIYKGEAKIISPIGDKIIPVELEVYPFELPEERHMYLTNWFEIDHIVNAYNVEEYSEEFWNILGRYARNMAEHRQNVVYTPWRKLINVYQESTGNWSFDYSNFDRFVQTFMDAGVDGRIEMTHIGAPSRGEFVGMGLYEVKVIDKISGKTIFIPGEKGMPLLLTDLQKHLVENEWLEKSMLHVSDEPNYYTIDEWKKIAGFAKKYAPGIKTIDALSVSGFDGLLDVAVPLTSVLDLEFETFKNEFQPETGKELWFYTCCVPYGHYPNRFLDYPLSDLRILHWMNYMFDIEGYLHWGFTYGWDEHDGTNFGPAKRFPPGDSHLIYPGKKGPMNSIRWETQREGLEDFEYFWLLESKVKEIKQKLGPAAENIPSDFRSKEICGKLVKSLADYIEDTEAFYSIKNLLASEISEIDKHPLFLFTTVPNINTIVVTGPAVVKIYGAVEEQAEVKVNGKIVELKTDGSFVKVVKLGLNDKIIRLEVEKNGKKKVFERKFEVK